MAYYHSLKEAINLATNWGVDIWTVSSVEFKNSGKG
jgi:hypothetical protein